MTQEKKDEIKQREEEVRKAEEAISYYDKLLSVPSTGSGAPLPEEIRVGMDILKDQRAINLDNIKESCIFELQRFIDSRGSINKQTGEVHIPLMTISAQNTASTIKKMGSANNLISKIEKTDSIEALNAILLKESTSKLCTSKVGGDLRAVIGQCMLITGVASDYTRANAL